MKLAMVLAAALAATTSTAAITQSEQQAPGGLEVKVTREGTGPLPRPGQVVVAHYVGTLSDGTRFDSSRESGEPIGFTLGRGQVIKGWDEAFARLRVGSTALLTIPPELAYGSKQRGPIPPNSTLLFEVELLDVKDGSLGDTIEQTIDAKGLEAGLSHFAELRAKGFAGLYVDESQLNRVGYKFLRNGKLGEAVAILRLNSELYPASANVHDSLGEALAASGQRDAAIAEYRRALKLDPKAENARKMLEQLRRGRTGQ
ncbi:MAG: FKBP-type peptidyl-prolyl cis-trans isomerase [Sphingomonas sp.]|nr:FKBP-type peptidyl-prolyl cis-trans isomerase [Sphingomonas sp.]